MDLDTITNNNVPIQRLNSDILLHIFELNVINADIFGRAHRTLQYARHASQVCHTWRSLLLDAPTIWARLLDMDCLSQMNASTEWLAELLRRTGSAPLWIRAVNSLQPDSPKHISWFIFAILITNWHRVEKLILRVGDPAWGVQNVYIWGWLYTPAPQLEVFDVAFGVNALLATLPAVPLFSGNAPALRRFACDHHPIDTHASWLPNLRSLDLEAPCTPADAITALQSTRNLEYLNIGELSTPEEDSSPGIVRLQNLLKIALLTPLQNCPFILANIDTPLSCSLLYFRSELLQDQLQDHIFVPALDALGTFVRRTLKVAAPTHLECYSGGDSLHLSYNAGTGTQSFTLWLECMRGFSYMRPNTTSILLNTFSCSAFAPVTNLLIGVPTETPVEPMLEFIVHLPGVEVLTAGETELELLTKVQELLPMRDGGPVEVFPALKTVIASEGAFALGKRSAVQMFLEKRRAAGRVVTVVNGGRIYGKYL